ncbi:MAG: hypothetical protein LC130_12095 [Bryobacterales bacterium]|nr:hypothetical protein [Bryobacterales bacterium]
MPRVFDYGPFDAGLARWIGWSIRSGFLAIGREIGYLAHRASSASGTDRSAWMYRCIVSCLLIAGQWALLSLSGVRTDHPIAFIVAWATVFLLPKPTPRLPLFVARALAATFTITNLAALYDLAKASYPKVVGPYGNIAGLCGIAIWIALSIWALASFRHPRRSTAVETNRQNANATADAAGSLNTPSEATGDAFPPTGITPTRRPVLQLIRGGRDSERVSTTPDIAE